MRIIEKKTFIKVKVENLSLFYYPKNENLIYADFKQFYESNNFQKDFSKRFFGKKKKIKYGEFYMKIRKY